MLVATVVATEKNITKSEKIILSKKLGKSPENRSFQGFSSPFGGDKRDRTADLLNAIQGENPVFPMVLGVFGSHMVATEIFVFLRLAS